MKKKEIEGMRRKKLRRTREFRGTWHISSHSTRRYAKHKNTKKIRCRSKGEKKSEENRKNGIKKKDGYEDEDEVDVERFWNNLFDSHLLIIT